MTKIMIILIPNDDKIFLFSFPKVALNKVKVIAVVHDDTIDVLDHSMVQTCEMTNDSWAGIILYGCCYK